MKRGETIPLGQEISALGRDCVSGDCRGDRVLHDRKPSDVAERSAASHRKDPESLCLGSRDRVSALPADAHLSERHIPAVLEACPEKKRQSGETGPEACPRLFRVSRNAHDADYPDGPAVRSHGAADRGLVLRSDLYL